MQLLRHTYLPILMMAMPPSFLYIPGLDFYYHQVRWLELDRALHRFRPSFARQVTAKKFGFFKVGVSTTVHNAFIWKIPNISFISARLPTP